MSEYAISGNEALGMVRKVASSAPPGYVDPLGSHNIGCRYVYEPNKVSQLSRDDVEYPETCRCIVGSILHDEGVDDKTLMVLDHVGPLSSIKDLSAYGTLLRDFGVEFPLKLSRLGWVVFRKAQGLSDNGVAWDKIADKIQADLSWVTASEMEDRRDGLKL